TAQLLLAELRQLAGHRHQLALLRPELRPAFGAEADGTGQGAEARGAGLHGGGFALLASALSAQLLLADFLELAGHRHQLTLLRPELVAAFRAEADGTGHGAEALGA
ncbi:MAG: hypothetical protein ACK55I_05010, partial [bacterium]